MSITHIQPITETYTRTIDYIYCTVTDVVLGQSAVIITQFYSENGSIIKTTRDDLSGDDYLNWGSDDKYIYDWICNKYNIVPL
jgi:hypothetical protein